jgi:hypothetical protein
VARTFLQRSFAAREAVGRKCEGWEMCHEEKGKLLQLPAAISLGFTYCGNKCGFFLLLGEVRITKPVVNYDVVSYYREEAVCPDLFAGSPDYWSNVNFFVNVCWKS